MSYDHSVLVALSIAGSIFIALALWVYRREMRTLDAIASAHNHPDQSRQEPYWQKKYEGLLVKYERLEREKPKNDEREIVGLTEDGEMVFKEKNDGRTDDLFQDERDPVQDSRRSTWCVDGAADSARHGGQSTDGKGR